MSASSQTRADQQKAARQPAPEPAPPAEAELAAGPQPAAVVQRALATPPPKPRPREILALQGAVGNQSVGRLLARRGAPAVTPAPAGAVQRSPAIPNWAAQAQRAKGFVQAHNTAQATTAYRALLAQVINSIPRTLYPTSLTTAPSGGDVAPQRVAPGDLMVVLRNQPGGAVTFPSEVERLRGNPRHLWTWIEFHEEAISDTEEWSRALIIHELQHAGDMVTAYREWSGQRAGARDIFLDYWHAWMRDREERHLGIYEYQAAQGGFASWSDEEKLEWITGVLGNVPPRRGRGTSFPGLARINSYYASVHTSPQGRAVRELFWEMLFGGQRDRTDPLQKATILNNFTQVRAHLRAGPHGREMRIQEGILRRVLPPRRRP